MSVNDDLGRVRDMLELAHEVMTFIEGENRGALDSDRKLMRAVSMSVGLIGEAASKISHEFRVLHSHIPWSNIIAMRNLLIHAYHRIDYDILWSTAQTRIPALIVELERILDDSVE